MAVLGAGVLYSLALCQEQSFDVEGVVLREGAGAKPGLHRWDACSGSSLQPGALGDSRPVGLTPIGEVTPVPTAVYMERVRARFGSTYTWRGCLGQGGLSRTLESGQGGLNFLSSLLKHRNSIKKKI